MTTPLAFDRAGGQNILMLAGGRRTVIFVGWPQLGQALVDKFASVYRVSKVSHSSTEGDDSVKGGSFTTWNVDISNEYEDSQDIYDKVLIFLLERIKDITGEEVSYLNEASWYSTGSDIVEQCMDALVPRTVPNAEHEKELLEKFFGEAMEGKLGRKFCG